MTKHQMVCEILEALYNMKKKWTNTNHGEYKNFMKRKKKDIEQIYRFPAVSMHQNSTKEV